MKDSQDNQNLISSYSNIELLLKKKSCLISSKNFLKLQDNLSAIIGDVLTE